MLKGCRHWGEGLLERFKGMFAFAIAERDSGRLVLARDRLGVKPLYLADGPAGLRFASTLPALLRAGGVDTTIDPRGAAPLPELALGRARRRARSWPACASCRRRPC